jgi:hypothetical protein
MTTITIRMKNVTVHRPGKRHAPKIDVIAGLWVPAGVIDVVAYPPGVAFELPEDEGRALLKIHSGEIVGGPS